MYHERRRLHEAITSIVARFRYSIEEEAERLDFGPFASNYAIERNLVQVRQARNEQETEGWNIEVWLRSLASLPLLAIGGAPRDAWVYPSTSGDSHKLVFRTAPENARFAPVCRSNGVAVKTG